MNFAYGVIAAVGILIAVSLGLIAASPGEVIEPRVVAIDDVDSESKVISAMSATPMTHNVETAEGSSVPGCEEADECYLPPSLEINVGDTVVWDNVDTAAHTVTSGNTIDGHDGMFDSGLFAPGGSFEYAFDTTGTFGYFCLVHPWMIGVITVDEIEGMAVSETDSEPKVMEEMMKEVMEPDTMEDVMEPDTMEDVMEESSEPKLMEETIEDVMEETTESEVMEETMEPDTMEDVMEESMEEVIEETMEDVMEESMEEVIEETMKDVMEEVIESDVMEEVMEDVMEETMEDVMEETMEDVMEETMEDVMEDVMEPETMEESTEDVMEEVMEPETMEESAEEVMEETMEPESIPEPETLPPSMEISIPAGSAVLGCETTQECYLPYEVTVGAGTTVTWSNDDITIHTVTSGAPLTGATTLFDSGIFDAGDTFEHTFDDPGTYDYFCIVHPWMEGIVHVN